MFEAVYTFSVEDGLKFVYVQTEVRAVRLGVEAERWQHRPGRGGWAGPGRSLPRQPPPARPSAGRLTVSFLLSCVTASMWGYRIIIQI